MLILDEKSAADRKPDMTDEQFYYKTRKNVIGPFKKQSWQLPADTKEKIFKAWEQQFTKLFDLLALKNSSDFVKETIKHPVVLPKLSDFLGECCS